MSSLNASRIRITVHALRAALWLSLVAWFVLFMASMVNLVPFYYRMKEPSFFSPVVSREKKIRLRNDSMGKVFFGAKRGPRNERRHEGIDILASVGTDVRAPRTGRVTYAATNRGYGEFVEIWHPDGYLSRYGHLSQISVKRGDWVKQNQVIGKTGRTGNANSRAIRPHLHFEIHDRQRPIDPLPLIQRSIKGGIRENT